jgi:outer membrane protein
MFMMKKLAQILTATICMAGLLSAPGGRAESLPLWEIGAGIGSITVPDYRGSDVTSTYVLPVPYIVYRGEFLKADRGGVRGTLFENDQLEVDLSLNGTLPANSKDNPTRRGMADLKPTVELGPTVNLNLWHAPNRKARLQLRAPVRASITVQSSPRHIGWLFSPNLNLEVRDPAGLPDWKLALAAGPIFANRKYNAHYYSVSAADATAARAAYAAAGGYSGAQITMILSKRFPRYWVGGFMRYDTVAGAVFDDSPLVKKRGGVSAGIAIAWVFSESSRRVTVEE